MSSNAYIPPYKVSGKAMNLIAEIAAAIERYRILLEGADGIRLRKVNHIRTIRGTTAIEGNTLTEEQITAILAGERVVAPPREIEEVQCAHAAYEAMTVGRMINSTQLIRDLMMKGVLGHLSHLLTQKRFTSRWRSMIAATAARQGSHIMVEPFQTRSASAAIAGIDDVDVGQCFIRLRSCSYFNICIS